MARFLIERNFAEQIAPNNEDIAGITQINDEERCKWVFSFLSADKRKIYCLYEAENPEAIRAAALRNNIPADVIVEVSDLRPEMFV